MSPEALATLFALAAAVYALLPTERRLDIRLGMRAVDWFVFWTALALVHYILFFPVLAAVGIAPHLGPWRWGFTPATTSYLVLVGATVFMAMRATRTTLARSKIPQFSELLEDLLRTGRYRELIFLLDRHLDALCRAYGNNYWLPRLRDRLDPPKLVILTSPERVPAPFFRHLARLLPPNGGPPQDAAKDVVRSLLLTDDFVRAIAKIQPDLGLRILEKGLHEGENFQSLWLTALLDDVSSVLFHEVTNAVTSGELDGGSRILRFYLDDIQRARSLLLNKALGDYVCAALDRLHPSSAMDRYNQSWADFEKGPRVTNPIYASLLVYHLMVSAAIHQNVAWPIPLYHFIHFTELITRNLAPDPRVDLTKEWPTPYHFFLDRIISWLCEWIECAKNQPSDDPNLKLRLDDLRDSNGDIPRNSVLALGAISKAIMTAESVDEHFKIRVLKSILELEGNQYGTPPRHPFGDLVLESIVAGGDDAQGRSDNVTALRQIIELGRSDLQHTQAVARLEQILARY